MSERLPSPETTKSERLRPEVSEDHRGEHGESKEKSSARSSPEIRNEQLELSPAQLENIEKQRHHDSVEARKLAQEVAQAAHEKQGTEKQDTENQQRHKRGHISQLDRDLGYAETMQQVQKHLSPTGRSFSKIIHQPAVEKFSDGLAKTIGRPTSILTGSATAFAAVLALYAYAKYYGFTLSGSEMIVTFAVGWIVGLFIDAWRILRRK